MTGDIKTDLSLHTSFAIKASCKGLIPIYSEIDVYRALLNDAQPYKILGGGSNVLLSGDIDSYVLHNQIKGISIIDEDDDTALVSVGGGEKWHQFVMWCISHDLAGLENLSLIPGNVGAAPMQNIGAYGVEQDSCFHSLKAIDLEEGTSKLFFKEDCKFGYRESIFKNEVKGRYIIVQVNYLLQKTADVNTSYGAIREELEKRKIENPTIKDVSDVIISIRQRKLPDPKEIPNAGSFFKNPIVTNEKLERLKKEFPDIKYYKVDDQHSKIPAAWLIDQAGWKGTQRSGAGVHKNHALVLVNYENASGEQLLKLSEDIMQSIMSKYDIQLEREVNVW